MADTPSGTLAVLTRQSDFVVLGLDLVFYGMLALVVAREFSYLLDLGIYTTLICFLLYYFFGISFILSLTRSLSTSQQ